MAQRCFSLSAVPQAVLCKISGGVDAKIIVNTVKSGVWIEGADRRAQARNRIPRYALLNWRKTNLAF